MEPTSIATGITATKATLDVAKLLMDKLNVSQIDVHDVRFKVQEMLIHVVNAQVALGDAHNHILVAAEENRELKREIQKLQDTHATTEALVFGDEVYLKRKPDGTLDGPFCPPCWDIDGKLVRLKLDGIKQYPGCPEKTLCRKYDCIVHKITYYLSAAKFNIVKV